MHGWAITDIMDLMKQCQLRENSTESDEKMDHASTILLLIFTLS